MKSYDHKRTVAIPLKGKSREQWHSIRAEGIGGSEVAAVLDRSRFTSSLDVYWDKIKETPRKEIESIYIESGNYHETWIRANYQYWDWNDPDPLQMFRNKHNKNRLRIVRDPRETYYLKDAPFVRVNVDGIITGCSTYPGVGILECKTRKSQSVHGLPNGVSEADYLQLQHGMFVLGASYGVMAYLLDGCEWNFVPFMADPQLHGKLFQVYDQFWSKVQQAREIKKKHKITHYTGIHTKNVSPELVAQLKSLEPNPTALSLEVIKDKIVPGDEKIEIEGSDDMYQVCESFYQAKEEIKQIEQNAKADYARILRHMENAQVMQFNDGSAAKVIVNKHGTVSLRVKMNEQ